MDFRKLSLAAALVALSPAIASAAPEDAALSACVRAFADKITPAGAAAPSVRIAYPQKRAASPIIDYYSKSFTFTMTAKNTKTGGEFASATCEASSRGNILALTTKTDSSLTTLASR